MDRTNRIMNELQLMVQENLFAPTLTRELQELITQVKSGEVNLMNYRRFDSRDQHGDAIIDAIVEADKRQQDKHLHSERQ